MAKSYVQYGCGWSAPQGWLNFDGSPTLFFERIPVIGKLYTKNAVRFPSTVRYGDVVRGLPIADESCDAIYCSHILEHLSLDDADIALANTFRYLKSGGIFRLVTPDLEQLSRDYLASNSADAALEFMDASFLGKRRRLRSIKEFFVDWLGNSAHLWIWDEKSMAARLATHGFHSIRRAQFGDASDPMFNAVEDESRFTGCLAMECKK